MTLLLPRGPTVLSFLTWLYWGTIDFMKGVWDFSCLQSCDIRSGSLIRFFPRPLVSRVLFPPCTPACSFARPCTLHRVVDHVFPTLPPQNVTLRRVFAYNSGFTHPSSSKKMLIYPLRTRQEFELFPPVVSLFSPFDPFFDFFSSFATVFDVF